MTRSLANAEPHRINDDITVTPAATRMVRSFLLPVLTARDSNRLRLGALDVSIDLGAGDRKTHRADSEISPDVSEVIAIHN
jgi:hypothetical protein